MSPRDLLVGRRERLVDGRDLHRRQARLAAEPELRRPLRRAPRPLDIAVVGVSRVDAVDAGQASREDAAALEVQRLEAVAGPVEPVAVLDAHVLGSEHQRGHPLVRGCDLLDSAQPRDPLDHGRDRDLAFRQTRPGLGLGEQLGDGRDLLRARHLRNQERVRRTGRERLDVRARLRAGRVIDPDPHLAPVPVHLTQRLERRLTRRVLLM
jgi:hypothetical protein